MKINRNTVGYLQHIDLTKHIEQFQEVLLKINRNPRYLLPIVKVRKDPDPAPYPWHWSCQICPGEPELGINFDKCDTWQTAHNRAHHHAQTHQQQADSKPPKTSTRAPHQPRSHNERPLR